jgi:collagenase-like PrtC family protease
MMRLLQKAKTLFANARQKRVNRRLEKTLEKNALFHFDTQTRITEHETRIAQLQEEIKRIRQKKPEDISQKEKKMLKTIAQQIRLEQRDIRTLKTNLK